MNTTTPAGETAKQQQLHEQTIAAIAKETHAEVNQVRELYEAAHATLAAQARIKTYVSVIATRVVRSALQEIQQARVQ